MVSTGQMVDLVQRRRQGSNAGGAKAIRVPTASEASKIFTDHTFQIGLKCEVNATTLSRNISKLRKCRQWIAIFKNSSAHGGA